MIIDAYITTRSVNFVNITIISNTNSLLTITDNKQSIKIKNPDINFRGLFFYQYHWEEKAQSSLSINLKITQDDYSIELKTSLST